MTTAYHRPKTLEEALILLARPDTNPLGGGTVVNQRSGKSFEVVDLQGLGIDKIHKVGEKLEIGAAVTLQALLEFPHLPEALKKAVKLEAPLNLRNMGTVAGTLVACDGRSPFATVILALDAKLEIQSSLNGIQTTRLGELLPLRDELLRGKLITRIDIPLNAKLAYESVARTPMDRPIVCVSLSQWPSGRARLVLGGWGKSPLLALDGNGPEGLEEAAHNAFAEASDQWASAEYRREIAVVLAKRCLEQ